MEHIPSNEPVMESKPGAAGWFSVWLKAVTKPNEQTFIEITNSPDATVKTAFTWMALTGLIYGLIVGIVSGASTVMEGVFSSDVMVFTLGFICLVSIAGAFIVPLWLAIAAGLSQWVAKLLGGTGTFEKLIYGYSAAMVPLLLVSLVIGLFSLIPFVGLCISSLGHVIVFYGIFLRAVVVKAVNHLGWGQAIGSALLPTVLYFLVICSILAFYLFYYMNISA